MPCWAWCVTLVTALTGWCYGPLAAEPPVARALEELAFFTNWVKIIGTYPRARDRAD
jgi:hypothetical protein